MFPLDFGNSTAMVSVDTSEAAPAVASITSLLKAMKYRGIFSAEFKRDARDGEFKILEVNTRPWWYVDFAARCGVDVCRMAYDDALELPVATIERYRVGRVLVFPYYDYFACQALRSSGDLTLAAWLRSWLAAMQPVFQLQDPAPGVRALAKTMVGFVGNRLSRVLPLVALVARHRV
jgi:predicted ATP-grasp superfamily ATP-dependent carboligase